MTNTEKFLLLDSAAMNEMLVGWEVVAWGSGMEKFYISNGAEEKVVEINNEEIAEIGNLSLCNKITSVRVQLEAKDPWDYGQSPIAFFSVFVKTENSIHEMSLFYVTVYDEYDDKNVFFTKNVSDFNE